MCGAKSSLALLLVGWTVLAHGESPLGQKRPRSALGDLAEVIISSPPDLEGHFLGYFGTFTGASGIDAPAKTWTPQADDKGCSEYKGPHPFVAVVHRGQCTFVQKAFIAQKAGAVGVLVVGDSSELILMHGGNTTEELQEEAKLKIFAVSVQQQFGVKLSEWNTAHSPESAAIVRVKPYVPPVDSLWDPSLLLQAIIATCLVAAGAYFATADLRQGSPLAAPEEDVVEIAGSHAFQFCAAGSVMLMVLFFTMKYMIYFIMFAFCISGAATIVQLVSAFLEYRFPGLRRNCLAVPWLCEVSLADLLASIPAFFLVAGWLWFRNTAYGFIFQDIIGAGFLCMLQRTLRLPNLKVATVLLCTMFFFDIFWVFLSPLLFRGKSVMVEVARGGGTKEAVPMLIRVPSIGSKHGGERMLGFGDIALPGLLVSYLLRHDALNRGISAAFRCTPRGYFMPSLLGYFFSLLATMVVLVVTGAGQPALLYLVPGTLGTALFLGWRRGELHSLWSGHHTANCHGNGGGSCEEMTPVVDVLGVAEPCLVSSEDLDAVYRPKRAHLQSESSTELCDV